MSDIPLQGMLDEILAVPPAELPVFHPVALTLQRMLADNDFSINEVADVVCQDQALAGRMLRMANSPLYVGRAKAATIKEAITRLGAQQVINITFAASQAAVHDSRDPRLSGYFEELWLHSHGSALGSRQLALQSGMHDLADQLYLAGLLHDVGKLFLLRGLEQLFAGNDGKAVPDQIMISALLETYHTAQGYRLVSHWDFPELYCEVVRDHHAEQIDPQNRAMAIVRFANRACHGIGLGMKKEPELDLLTLPEADMLAISESQVNELVALLLESSLWSRTIV